MAKLRRGLLLATLLTCMLHVAAENDGGASSSLYLQADDMEQVVVPFRLKGEGTRFQPTWGLDQAWISEQNIRKGINHMGKENIGIGRSCFGINKPLTNDSVLNNTEINRLRERNKWFNLVSTTLPLVLTADQEGGTSDYYVTENSANNAHWAANINSHVHWLQKNSKHPVVGISIFNEPDYWIAEEGASTTKQTQIARLLRENYPRLDDAVITGGNTLNDDKALQWYNAGRSYIEWGNTHQLAGSFDNYAKFYQQVVADGKVGYADEMHNVGEAMIGLEYGMTIGIWWGFDSRARGEFCDISRHGERLSYAEHRTNWTAASVWRHDDGRVKAFIGSSERQAATTTYRFVSPDRDVYFDGHGPARTFMMEIPGGTVGSYQKGQTNAERVIDIQWGEDVPPAAIEADTYKLVNKGNGNVAMVSGSNIVTGKFTGAKTQQWNVSPVSPRIGGDYSFYEVRCASDGKVCMDVENYSCVSGANVMAYTPSGSPSSNQQWYLQYAGNGYYYLRNRESALYLSASSSSKADGTNVCQLDLQASPSRHVCQLWRLLPVEVAYETEAPAQPTGLVAMEQQASVKLSWDVSPEDDIEGYMVLRSAKEDGEWNTIARCLATTHFVDNTCRQGEEYIYKVRAIDKAQNLSACSDSVTARPTGSDGLIAQWLMDESLMDETENRFDAVASSSPAYTDGPSDGMKALNLEAGNNFVQLPYEVAGSDELTICMWVNWMGTGSRMQHLFSFGNGPDSHVSLTASNQNRVMSLILKDGAYEQVLNSKSQLTPKQWKHVAISTGRGRTVVYVDGQQVAGSTTTAISLADLHPVVNYIGRSQSGSDPLLKARIADVRIYNVALESEDISAVMQGGNPTALPTLQPDAWDATQPAAFTLDGRQPTKHHRGIIVTNRRKELVR